MRINSLYHYLFGLEQYQEEIIENQKRLRHELHKQIVFSKLKLKPTVTIYKSGFHEIDKMNSQKAHLIPIPNDKNKKRKLK